MSNKNCIIIHGCPSNEEKVRSYNKHWIPWTKSQLLGKNIETKTPLMPTPWQPDYKKFKNEFEKYKVDENTILVGHSCGCAFLVRRLGETKKSISKLILVAPWKIPEKDIPCEKEFYTYEIDKTIKHKVNKIFLFTSDNEKEMGKNSLTLFHNVLGGQIINLTNHWHYCFSDMKTEEFPELLKVIIE